MIRILFIQLLLLGSIFGATFNVSTTPEFRQALQDATQNRQNDTIILADRTYKTTDDDGGPFIFLDDEEYALKLIGSSSENVILSGDNQHQVLNYDAIGLAILILEKLSFIDGNATVEDGGALYAGGHVDISDCKFIGNSSKKRGGGFYSAGIATVTNSTFKNNSTSNKGGGFYSYIGEITNSIFEGNTAVDDGGGFYSTSTVTVTNSTFKDNSTSNKGGGFYSSGGEITNSMFEVNIAVDGGGFYSTHTVAVTNSTFKDNSTSNKGGGFYSSAVVTNSIFEGNTAVDDGGGFYSARASVLNSLFSNNNATSRSKGLYSFYEIMIYNSIFLGDDSIYTYRTESIIENNYINSSYINAASPNSVLNNIYLDVSLSFIDEINSNYHLTASSDLIDAGTSSVGDVTLPVTDMDGNARVSGSSVDIGPYEYHPAPPSIPTNVNASDGTFEQVVGTNWSEVPNATQYDVYRSESQGTVGSIVGITVSTSLTDDTIEADTKYYYRVQACNDNGCSDYSEADSGYIGTVNEWYKVQPAITSYILF